MYPNGETKKIRKIGQFWVKPDPKTIFSERKISLKNFSCRVDFKNEVFRKPDFPTKTGSGCLGDFKDMSTHHKYSLLILLNDMINKMSKIDQSGAKPETGNRT